MTKLQQALTSLGIRLAVLCGLVVLNFIISSISGWSVPDPSVTLPVLSLVLSEADTWLVDYAKANNIPVPAQQ
ncbi:MAG: hypothetical protein WAM89_07415 [Terriglobales bacterium]